MSDSELNIAIANACGWTEVRFTTVVKNRIMREGVWGRNEGGELLLVPNYCGDLNAMATAEAILTNEQHSQYRARLWDAIAGTSKWGNLPDRFARDFYSATAKQRALAFCAVKGIAL